MPNTSPNGLSPVQLQVAAALASGASITKAASTAQISRTTIYSWIKNIPDFAKTVQNAAIEAAQSLQDQLHDAAQDAISTVSALMNDTSAAPAVRLRAALAILNRPTFPDKPWNFAYPTGSPSELRQQQINNQLQAELKAMQFENAMRRLIVAEAETKAKAAQNETQPAQNRTILNKSEHKNQNPPFDPEKERQRIADALLATPSCFRAGAT